MNNGTERFSIEKRVKSVGHAWRGLRLFFKTTHNAWVHVFLCLISFGAGFYFQVTSVEWLALVIVAGLLFTAEAFNTAIEIDMDLTSPDFHPHARDTKDVAAGAVLISGILMILINILVFATKIQ
ncbi:MAG: diacylglycerol kinase family protein [Candidatus Paceibacterota bacterium]